MSCTSHLYSRMGWGRMLMVFFFRVEKSGFSWCCQDLQSSAPFFKLSEETDEFTPPKTNECPMFKEEIHLPTSNYWFSGDMLVFRGVLFFWNHISSFMICRCLSAWIWYDLGIDSYIGQNNLTPTYTNPWFAPIRLQYFSRKRFINNFFYPSNLSSVDGFNVSATWHLSPSIFEDQNTNTNPVRCEEVAGIDPYTTSSRD